MKVLVIIPCYNESENICRVVQRLKATCPDVDYLVVNDCSTDDSARILRENGYNYLDLPLNLGIGGGVQSGYLYATAHDYDITVQMDGDGQHDPQYLYDVIRPVAEGRLDMCIGSRFIKKEGFQTSFMRRVGRDQRLPGLRQADDGPVRAALRPGLPGAGGNCNGYLQRL